MPKNWGYYHVDCGHFPSEIKLCFSNDTFQRVLKDHGITYKANALEDGIAECHYLTNGKQGVIIMVFDLAECVDEDPAYLAGIVAHEATHCVCRVFEHIGEEPDEIGEESRAYLTEHIVRQITTGIRMEMDKNARKENRTVLDKKSKGKPRTVVQMDKHGNGSAGPDNIPKPKHPPGRAKNKDGGAVPKAKGSVQATRRPWIYCTNNQVYRGRG